MRFGPYVSDIKSDSGSGSHLWSLATELPCRGRIAPPIELYDAWLAEARSSDPRGKSSLTGKKLHRAVTMKRNGQTSKDIGLAIGLGHHMVRIWLAKLPPELAA